MIDLRSIVIPDIPQVDRRFFQTAAKLARINSFLAVCTVVLASEHDFWPGGRDYLGFGADRRPFWSTYRAAFVQVLSLIPSFGNWRCAQSLDGRKDVVE
jgi:hypothetical protein